MFCLFPLFLPPPISISISVFSSSSFVFSFFDYPSSSPMISYKRETSFSPFSFLPALCREDFVHNHKSEYPCEASIVDPLATILRYLDRWPAWSGNSSAHGFSPTTLLFLLWNPTFICFLYLISHLSTSCFPVLCSIFKEAMGAHHSEATGGSTAAVHLYLRRERFYFIRRGKWNPSLPNPLNHSDGRHLLCLSPDRPTCMGPLPLRQGHPA